MLRLESVVIRQGDFALTADWSVPEAAVTAVIGPSGAGKSTLLSVIGGFYPQTSGRILWQGKDFGGVPPADRPVASLFQDNNLFPHLTVAQNVGLALRPSLRLGEGDVARVLAALAEVGLDGMESRKPSELSGGQASRAALARVLLQDRPVVLLDEPFAALGPALKDEMLDLVAEKLGGRTVIMVSHDPKDARRIAKSMVFVSNGVAHPPAALPDALDAPTSELAAYLGQV